MELLCLGDIAIAKTISLQESWLLPGDFSPDKDSKILFNWELPASEAINGTPRTSGPRLLSSPDSPNFIKNWSPGFASLATNHILDGGEAGLVETKRSLHRLGFRTVGAGVRPDEITQPLIWETGEGRLAILNWVFPETHPDWQVAPGPNCWPGIDAARYAIQLVQNEADWVIVVVHWSDELFQYPRPEDRIIARQLSLAGANMVIGHHPHVVRGMEVFGICPVFYSLGNFYFSDFPDPQGGWITQEAPRNREGLGILVSFERGKIPKWSPRSFWSTQTEVRKDALDHAVRRMKSTSHPFQMNEEKYRFWYNRRKAIFLRGEARWEFGLRRLGVKGVVLKLCEKK